MRPSFAVRETQSLGQQMLNAPVGINGLIALFFNEITIYMQSYLNGSEEKYIIVLSLFMKVNDYFDNINNIPIHYSFLFSLQSKHR